MVQEDFFSFSDNVSFQIKGCVNRDEKFDNKSEKKKNQCRVRDKVKRLVDLSNKEREFDGDDKVSVDKCDYNKKVNKQSPEIWCRFKDRDIVDFIGKIFQKS